MHEKPCFVARLSEAACIYAPLSNMIVGADTAMHMQQLRLCFSATLLACCAGLPVCRHSRRLVARVKMALTARRAGHVLMRQRRSAERLGTRARRGDGQQARRACMCGDEYREVKRRVDVETRGC
jgi:hypothetical protein